MDAAPTGPASPPIPTPRSVSVVIVNYNAGEYLARCLASLAPGLDGLDWEATVVDNASVDGSERYALEAGARVRLLPAGSNAGFGAAVNRAALTGNRPLLLLLNPDAELLPGTVQALIDELDRVPGCAVVGPGILNKDGTIQGSARRDPSWMTGLFGRSTRLTRLFPNSRFARRNVVAPEVAQGEHSLEVDWVSGACMLLRREPFERCGGFDPAFFLYWEDADLCRRLRRLGHSVRYRPGVRVRHVVGASSESARPLAIRAFHRSAAQYYATHVSRSALENWFVTGILQARCALLLRRHR